MNKTTEMFKSGDNQSATFVDPKSTEQWPDSTFEDFIILKYPSKTISLPVFAFLCALKLKLLWYQVLKHERNLSPMEVM